MKLEAGMPIRVEPKGEMMEFVTVLFLIFVGGDSPARLRMAAPMMAEKSPVPFDPDVGSLHNFFQMGVQFRQRLQFLHQVAPEVGMVPIFSDELLRFPLFRCEEKLLVELSLPAGAANGVSGPAEEAVTQSERMDDEKSESHRSPL